MSRLPTAEEKKVQHRERIELAACRRCYNLVEAYHPDLLEDLTAAVQDGISPLEVKRWIRGIAGEDQLFIQRCVNAARYIQATLETV